MTVSRPGPVSQPCMVFLGARENFVTGAFVIDVSEYKFGPSVSDPCFGFVSVSSRVAVHVKGGPARRSCPNSESRTLWPWPSV